MALRKLGWGPLDSHGFLDFWFKTSAEAVNKPPSCDGFIFWKLTTKKGDIFPKPNPIRFLNHHFSISIACNHPLGSIHIY